MRNSEFSSLVLDHCRVVTDRVGHGLQFYLRCKFGIAIATRHQRAQQHLGWCLQLDGQRLTDNLRGLVAALDNSEIDEAAQR